MKNLSKHKWLMVKTNRKKTILIVLICSLINTSCLPVFDTLTLLFIDNHSNDTIIVGMAGHNCIDSVTCFMSSTIHHESEIDFNGNNYLNLGKGSMIMPDSVGEYGTMAMFSTSQTNSRYFFIIKWETAKKHTWEEICREEIYDTLIVVTQEMLKDGNRIKYWGAGKPIIISNNE